MIITQWNVPPISLCFCLGGDRYRKWPNRPVLELHRIMEWKGVSKKSKSLCPLGSHGEKQNNAKHGNNNNLCQNLFDKYNKH